MTSSYDETPKIGNSAMRQLPSDDRDIPPLPSLLPDSESNVKAVVEEEDAFKNEEEVPTTNVDDLLGQIPNGGISEATNGTTSATKSTSFFSWFTSSDAAVVDEAISKDLQEAVAAAIEEEATNPMEAANAPDAVNDPFVAVDAVNEEDQKDLLPVQLKEVQISIPVNHKEEETEETTNIPSTSETEESMNRPESSNGAKVKSAAATEEEEDEFVVLPTNESARAIAEPAAGASPPEPLVSTDAAPWSVVRSRSLLTDPPTALAILRKFCTQTRPGIWKQYGGTLSKSFWSYLFSSSSQYNEQSTFAPYAALWRLLQETEGEPPRPADEAHAFAALAAFVHLFGIWGHASSAWSDPHKHDAKHRAIFLSLQVAILHAAGQLVTHGCLDHLYVTTDGVEDTEGTAAAQILATSVFNTDLTVDRVELAALQFLLSTGLRPVTLLRGSYLLQTIRTLYHIYLTTETRNNRVAARAALQQLVTSVFSKVVQEKAPISDLAFPTENHRDAFLVLRSLCKLSMRSLPEDPSMHSHIGLQTSASHDTWDADRWNGGAAGGADRQMTQDSQNSASSRSPARKAQLISTGALHPALESKLLALELILYILQHVDFATHDFIHTCGSQFHVAIRNYLCVSLLKNCTSGNAHIVSWSLRIFVPVVHHFRTVLKTEIEAFVTNVFFVILDSQHSPAEHKSIVVRTFQEICSDPNTLAEIFLNYDCDLSAVDLFHRIVQTLSRLSRSGLQPTPRSSLMGPSEAILEKQRNESRDLRLEAMRALRQILASLHASIVEPMSTSYHAAAEEEATPPTAEVATEPSLVDIYDSKKKRRAEEAEAVIRFNQKPSAGIAYAAKCGHLVTDDPGDVARYLLQHKDDFDKAMIGEYLGREVDYQNGFSIRVLHEYVRLLDFSDLVFDDAIRYFLSGFRLPGEAQKVRSLWLDFAWRTVSFHASHVSCCPISIRLIASWRSLLSDLLSRIRRFFPLPTRLSSCHSPSLCSTRICTILPSRKTAA
jgi:Guanine nucleotide exchange factor in Golgi transport N-terminal/Sec7 domain/Dimerisation and cyclophilin-binding domain of Mon2